MIDFESLRVRYAIDYVLQEMGYSATGRRYDCPLPDCTAGSKQKSFSVTGDRWYCHRCKQGGDVVDLVKKVRNVGTIEAVEYLSGEKLKRNSAGRVEGPAVPPINKLKAETHRILTKISTLQSRQSYLLSVLIGDRKEGQLAQLEALHKAGHINDEELHERSLAAEEEADNLWEMLDQGDYAMGDAIKELKYRG